MILSFINIRKVTGPSGMLKTSGFALGFQHSPWLMNGKSCLIPLIRVGSKAVCNYLFQADLISTPISGKFFSEYLIGLENISAALLPLPLIQEE